MQDFRFKIGHIELDANRALLSDGAVEKGLEPKELSVLLHLVERAPNVVSLAELTARSWPDVVVGDNTLHQVISGLRRAFGDSPRSPRFIETHPKRGYRLMVVPEAQPPQAALVAASGPSGAHELPPLAANGSWLDAALTLIKAKFSLPIAASVAGVLLAAIFLVNVLQPLSDATARSIAVYGFVPAEPDRDSSEVAAQLNDLLFRNLSRAPGIRVLDLSGAQDPNKLEREQETYSLRAELRNSAETGITIDVRLTKPATNELVWAEAIVLGDDRSEPVLVQIARSVRLAIHVYVESQLHRLSPSDFESRSPAAIAYLEGVRQWALRSDPRQRAAAIVSFERATVLDEKLVEAWAAYAYALAYTAQNDPTYINARQRRNRFDEALNNAFSINPEHPIALAAQARMLIEGDIRLQSALESARRATELAPDSSEAHYAHAEVLKLSGLDDEADEALSRAIALNPLSDILPRIRAEMKGDYEYAAKELRSCAGYCTNTTRTDIAFAMYRAARLANNPKWIESSAKVAHGLLSEEVAQNSGGAKSGWVRMKLGMSDPATARWLTQKQPPERPEVEWVDRIDLKTGEYQFAFMLARLGMYDRAFETLNAVYENNSVRLYEVAESGGIEFWPEDFRRDPRFHAFWNRPGMAELATILRKNGRDEGLPLSAAPQ